MENNNQIESSNIEKSRNAILQKVREEGLYFKVFNVDVRFLKFSDSKSRVIMDEEFNQLRESIKLDPDFLKIRFPFINTHPGREWIIIGGDKRTRAAIAEGYQTVPVMFVNVDPSKENAWNKKDNHHNGQWDEVELKKELIQLHESGYNMNSLSFTPNTLVQKMGYDQKKTDAKENPDNKGTTPRKKGKVQVGAKIECPNCHAQFAFAQEHSVEETTQTT